MAAALPSGVWTGVDVPHTPFVDARHPRLLLLVSSPTACGALQGRGDINLGVNLFNQSPILKPLLTPQLPL